MILRAVKRLAAILILITVAACTTFVSAENAFSPYYSYEYNSCGETVAAPIGYMVSRTISASDWHLDTPMNAPYEIIKADSGNYFILDSNNNRVIETDNSFELVKNHDLFTDENGKQIQFKGAQGLAVSKSGDIYIGDTEAGRILVFKNDGALKNIIKRPDEALHDIDSPFRVTHLLIDEDNRLYALADSINIGAMVFDENGKFLSFFGSNPIKKTSEVLLNALRKKFMTREQIAGLVTSTPVTFTSFTFNKEGFIYTVTADNSATAQAGNVRLLNYEGSNVLGNVAFGDTESDRGYFENTKHTEWCDVSVDSKGFINLLDRGRGKVFQYTEAGQLVSVFGVYSSQKGGFVKPVAIETNGDEIAVLDSGKNEIICFSPTGYGKDIRTALSNIGTTDTRILEESCTNILKQNSNSTIPYYGLGMMYDSQGKYDEAMKQFKISDGYKMEYSNAFRQQRQIIIRNNFIWIAIAILAVIIAIIVLLRAVSKRMKREVGEGVYTVAESKYFFPFYTAFHPIDGFSQFKIRNNASVSLSIGIIISWFLVTTLQFFKTGYCFNNNRATDYSLPLTLFKTVFVFVLFVVANWSVCTLLDGKGSFKDILATTAYSLCPLIIAMLINIALSNILTLDEQAFMNMIMFIGYFWSGVELVLGMYSIHQYSFSKTLFSLLLTAVGMAVIVFLIVLFYSLLQQTYSFGESVNTEISLR